jgi:hypothetical protein
MPPASGANHDRLPRRDCAVAVFPTCWGKPRRQFVASQCGRGLPRWPASSARRPTARKPDNRKPDNRKPDNRKPDNRKPDNPQARTRGARHAAATGGSGPQLVGRLVGAVPNTWSQNGALTP